MEGIRPIGSREGRVARHAVELIDWIGPLPEHHQELPIWGVLKNEVGALVHRPDVVVLVDTHGVGEAVPVTVLAEFLDEVAAPVELEDLRLAASGDDEDVALRVGGHSDALTHVKAGRHLDEADRIERNFWGGRPGFRRFLGERGRR